MSEGQAFSPVEFLKICILLFKQVGCRFHCLPPLHPPILYSLTTPMFYASVVQLKVFLIDHKAHTYFRQRNMLCIEIRRLL